MALASILKNILQETELSFFNIAGNLLHKIGEKKSLEILNPAYGELIWAKFSIKAKDFTLTNPEIELVSPLLELIATSVIVIQLNEILKKYLQGIPKPTLKTLRQILRLLRNAFAHDPLSPIWKLKAFEENKHYEIVNVISVDTNGLNGKPVDYNHYGGPICIYQLIQYVRDLFLQEFH